MVWLAFLSAWATIVDQSITIKLASIYKPSVIAFITPTIENKGFDQKVVNVVSNMFAKKFILGKNVVNKVKTFDEKN